MPAISIPYFRIGFRFRKSVRKLVGLFDGQRRTFFSIPRPIKAISILFIRVFLIYKINFWSMIKTIRFFHDAPLIFKAFRIYFVSLLSSTRHVMVSLPFSVLVTKFYLFRKRRLKAKKIEIVRAFNRTSFSRATRGQLHLKFITWGFFFSQFIKLETLERNFSIVYKFLNFSVSFKNEHVSKIFSISFICRVI